MGHSVKGELPEVSGVVRKTAFDRLPLGAVEGCVCGCVCGCGRV